MTVQATGAQYAQPLSAMWPAGIRARLAASACVVMPIAAQTTAAIAIIRAIVMLSPVVGPASGGLRNKIGRIDVAQPKNYTGPGDAPLAVLSEQFGLGRQGLFNAATE